MVADLVSKICLIIRKSKPLSLVWNQYGIWWFAFDDSNLRSKLAAENNHPPAMAGGS